MFSPIFDQITSPPQTAAEVIVNEALLMLQHLAVYAVDPDTTTGLTLGYKGGRWGGFAVTAGTVALTASSTNYVVVNRSTGAVSVSTATTNWDNLAAYARVYKLPTTGSAINWSTAEDHRSGPGGVHGGIPASFSVADLSDVDLSGIADGDTLVWDEALGLFLPGAAGGGGGGGFTLGTPVALNTLGSATITGIPATANYIKVIFDGVSTVNSVPINIRVGTSSGIFSGAYSGSCTKITPGLEAANNSSSFNLYFQNSNLVFSGSLTLVRVSGNIWEADGVFSGNAAGTPFSAILAGSVSLSAALDRVQIYPNSGTFDAGNFNVIYS